MQCPRCSTALEFMGTRKFHEGKNWGVFGELGELFRQQTALRHLHVSALRTRRVLHRWRWRRVPAALNPFSRPRVRAYIAALPPRARRHLQEIRRLVRAEAPDATESFSYRIPGFRLDDRVFLYYAAFATHCSMYPMGAKIRSAHAAALKDYKTSTGTIQFPLEKPLPVVLVKKLIRSRIAEVRKGRF
jgi:uncharacterized protein YdhG (YjbR/CyaY superfamily)